jgi:hypothetical protein
VARDRTHALGMLVVFVVIEPRHPDPTVDLSLFRIPAVAPSLPASLLQALGNAVLMIGGSFFYPANSSAVRG